MDEGLFFAMIIVGPLLLALVGVSVSSCQEKVCIGNAATKEIAELCK